MNEEEIVEQFEIMCGESVNPDLCSILIDDIIPALRLSRTGLDDAPCPICGDCGFVKEKCVNLSVDVPCPRCSRSQEEQEDKNVKR